MKIALLFGSSGLIGGHLLNILIQNSDYNKIKILHVITALDPGGAETMLYKLLKIGIGDTMHDSKVICLADGGKIGERLKEIGIKVDFIGIPIGLSLIHI